MLCKKCGAEVTKDEASFSRKCFGSGEDNFYCIECVAKTFNIPVWKIYKKIEEYKEDGCCFFK